jgi:hypothetical protein
MVKQGFLDFSSVEQRFPKWQQYTQEWAARAARGPGVSGGPERTKTSYFYQNGFTPFGRTWGGVFAPTEICAPVEPPICDPGTSFDPAASPAPTPCIEPSPTHGKPTPTPTTEPSLPPASPVPTKKPRLKRFRRRRRQRPD